MISDENTYFITYLKNKEKVLLPAAVSLKLTEGSIRTRTNNSAVIDGL